MLLSITNDYDLVEVLPILPGLELGAHSGAFLIPLSLGYAATLREEPRLPGRTNDAFCPLAPAGCLVSQVHASTASSVVIQSSLRICQRWSSRRKMSLLYLVIHFLYQELTSTATDRNLQRRYSD